MTDLRVDPAAHFCICLRKGEDMGGRSVVETLVITVAAFVTSAIVFALFNFLYAGIDPIELFYNIYAGAFGSSFAIQNTLSKAAPLLLTALCTALPARLGL